uniref:dTTP/UTP pyrophosphatase n=1 Tax=Schlesneria paludicola TaxID=360056 RepID=A0A7C2PBF4_9PLAN
MTPTRYILGSRSPRRRELLARLVPVTSIEVVPPARAEEPGFDGLSDWPSIRAHLQEIARHKAEQVRQQIGRETAAATIITADTTIVCGSGANLPGDSLDPAGVLQPPLLVLGQPPERDDWTDVVRGWFHTHYAGRTHMAATAVCVVSREGTVSERVVTTAVTIRHDVDRWLEWYLGTGEPRGKAGGYALQGAGSVFVTQVTGSLSNVVGLPLEALAEMLGISSPPHAIPFQSPVNTSVAGPVM